MVYALIISLLFSLTLSPPPVVALDSTTSANIQQLREQNRNQIQERVEVRQQNMAQTKALIQQQREQFQSRLQQIKDLRKRQVLQNLDTLYTNTNTRWTTHFSNVLDRLTDLATRLKSVASQRGDTTAVSDLDAQLSLIALLKTEVATQKDKVYTLDITDEDSLRPAAQEIHTQLKSDLKLLRDKIQSIRDSLIDIATTLKPMATNL